jgi:putative ABC transport system permease protein
MWFTTFIVKNLSRRLLRSLLTIFAIAIAIGAVVALVGVANGFEQTFLRVYSDANVDMLVVRSGARHRTNSTLDEDLGDRIKRLPGVKDVYPGLFDVVSFPELNLYVVPVQGWEPETPVFNHLTVTEGRLLRADDNRGVMLGTVLAGKLDKQVGDTVEVVEGAKFTVVGIYESGNVIENGAMIIPLKSLQTIMGLPGKVTGFSLVLDRHQDHAAVEEIGRQVRDLAPGLKAMPATDFIKQLTEIRLAKSMAWLTSAIALLIGFFGIMNTMVMSVNERTREIGILRAVGWQLGRVIRMIMLESVFLSILGAAVGMVGATLAVKMLTRLPNVSGLIDGRIPPIFLVYGLVIAVILGVLGSIVPALRAVRMLPTEALRHE